MDASSQLCNTASLAHDAVEGASNPSGLIGQIQKMTVAAMQMAELKVWAQQS